MCGASKYDKSTEQIKCNTISSHFSPNIIVSVLVTDATSYKMLEINDNDY